MRWETKPIGAALILALLAPAGATAQELEHGAPSAPESTTTMPQRAPEFEPDVLVYNLSGPRVGATFAPDGMARSQFGWHSEHSIANGTRGPWFIVESIGLVAGVESGLFLPSGTLVFGARLPNSLEFGLGPSVSIGGPRGVGSSLVIAIGQSFRVGAIRVPVNLALATDRYGQRVTLLTGWAVRDRVGAPAGVDHSYHSPYSLDGH